MKRRSMISLLLVLLLSACQMVIPPADVPPQAEPPQAEASQAQAQPGLIDADLGQKLQAALEAAVDDPNTTWPGAVLYVAAPALGVWSGAAGIGAVETDTPMRPHDRFRAGSLTKPFIATVILQLVEEGRFALDDPIDSLLPAEIAGMFANSDPITVRMLLNHTSGLPDFMDLAGPEIVANPGKVWEAEEFLRFAAAQEPWFAPGEAQYYSNTGYTLLGVIIEETTGQPWREEVRRRVFKPLGLENTFLPAPEETTIPGDYAHGYADFGSGILDATELATASVVGAAGGQSLITNAPDLARFLDALLAGQLFQESGTLDEMLGFVPFAPNHPQSVILTGYGLGINQASYGDGLNAIGHSGDTPGGYHSFVYHFPDPAITIAGAVNAADPAAGYAHLMPRVLEVLVPGYTMTDFLAPQQPDVEAALQGLLDDQVREQGILGMIMAARLPDGTLISRSSGSIDPAGENLWTLDTISALGSVTKSYTAVVILQLVEEGKLSLDDTIDAWFPDQPNADRITIRMLLSHTSGLANYIQPENERDPKWAQEWTPLELIAEANRIGPVDEPGSSVAHYANTNYFLLGLIIEAITGNTWAQEVQSRIIEPLGLENTTFMDVEGVWGGILVEGYAKTADGYLSVLDVPDLPHPSTAWAAGGVASGLSDLMTFASALFDGALVSQESLATMATAVAADAESGRLWGLGGATIEGLPGAYGMGGDVPGYHAFFVGLQHTNLVVAGFVNTEEGDIITPSLMAFGYLLSMLPQAQRAAGTPAQQPDMEAALHGLLDDQVRQQGIVGMAMAVRLPDGTVVGGASGPTAPSSDTPWTIDTVSAIGSVTKSFTAVVIMQLVEEGRLSLDDTIGTWFPDQPNADRITVRMLLSHTSGLANYISAENVMDPKWTEEWVPSDLIGEANRLGPVREPGGNSAYYANTNYIVLGLIVEAITGNRWAEEVRSRIIEPLHLEDTGFIGEEGIWGGVMVDGYSKAVEGYHRVQDSPYPHPSTSWSAGVMVSSVADLMTFASALVDDELVSEETLAEMATPLGTDADNGVVWGLGLLTVESLPGVFAMEGGIPGYNAFVVGDLERKILVVTLVNTEEGDAIGPSLMALDYVRSMVPPE